MLMGIISDLCIIHIYVDYFKSEIIAFVHGFMGKLWFTVIDRGQATPDFSTIAKAIRQNKLRVFLPREKFGPLYPLLSTIPILSVFA